MATVKFLVGFICLAFIGRDWGIGSGTLGYGTGAEKVVRERIALGNARIIEIARSQIGIRETGCENCGIAVAGYLAVVGFKTPQPYCAAFVSWCHVKAGYLQPKTAWSPALFPKERLVKIVTSGKAPHNDGSWRDEGKMQGIVYGIYFTSLGRIGHCGLIEILKNDLIYGIEANTNAAGLREGDGVWRKIRHKRTIHCYANWLK